MQFGIQAWGVHHGLLPASEPATSTSPTADSAAASTAPGTSAASKAAAESSSDAAAVASLATFAAASTGHPFAPASTPSSSWQRIASSSAGTLGRTFDVRAGKAVGRRTRH